MQRHNLSLNHGLLFVHIYNSGGGRDKGCCEHLWPINKLIFSRFTIQWMYLPPQFTGGLWEDLWPEMRYPFVAAAAAEDMAPLISIPLLNNNCVVITILKPIYLTQSNLFYSPAHHSLRSVQFIQPSAAAADTPNVRARCGKTISQYVREE